MTHYNHNHSTPYNPRTVQHFWMYDMLDGCTVGIAVSLVVLAIMHAATDTIAWVFVALILTCALLKAGISAVDKWPS